MNHDIIETTDGFKFCTVCGGANKSLTTECSGAILSPDDIDAVRGGINDFKNGRWIKIKLAGDSVAPKSAESQ